MDSGKVTYAVQNAFGSTAVAGNQLAHAEGCLLYVAGSLVVFYSPKLDEQIGFLKHNGGSISAIAVSDDEKILAVADKSKQSSIFLYSIEDLQSLDGSSPKPISILRAHKHTVDILTFSANSKYLLSISNHDGSMFLWEKGENITKNRVSKAVTRAVFDGSGDLVTIGRGFLKLWKFNDGEVMRKKEQDCWLMEGKVLTFGKTFSSKEFVEIVFYKPSNPNNPEKVLLLSSDGMLCIMSGKYERVEKWIDLIITHASGLRVIGDLALCGGDNAVIKAVDLSTLTLKLKFPKPPPTTKENLSEQQELQYGEDEEFPPCIAILKVSQYIVTLYSNRTMFVWELREQPVAFRSILSHRGGISSLSLLQEIKGDICFIASCSEDGTVRLWHFYKKEFEGQRRSIDIARTIGLKRNVYCRNLTRIIYSHSEFPIIRTKLFLNNTLACISSQQFLLYSLDHFQLLLLHSFDEQQGKVPARIRSLQTNGQMVLIGDEAGKLKVLKVVGESVVKVKEWQLQMPIEGLQVFSGRILAWGKGRMKCMSIEGDVLLNAYNVQSGWGWNNSIVYCQKRSLIIYSLNRGKKSGSLMLSHELDQLQSVRTIKASSWLISIITTKNRLIVANYSAVILYSQELCQAVTDLIVSEGGEIIICFQSGTIQIRRQKQGKFVRIDEKVKRWFEMNDMSWMDGSVWASSKHRSYSNSNPTPIELEGVEHQNSIRLGEIEGSVKSPLKKGQDIMISYRNQENKRSIFDPTTIQAQLNKVKNNMNEIQKQRVPLMSQKSKSKRRIFQKELDLSQKSEYAPAFTSNLIESVMRDAPPSLLRNDKQAISTEDHDKVSKSAVNSSLHISFVELEQPPIGSPQSQFNYTQSRSRVEGSKVDKGNFMKTVDMMMQEYDSLKNSREDVHTMVLEHYGEFQRLYKLLSMEFGKGQQEQWKARVSEKFSKYASAFLSDFNSE